ncbi:MAG TPA: adenylosuccinate synthase [Aggregatilineales bacterium]|nr:adenylosuccinate synthase [Aggregatilineales bacterium]
MPATVLVGAQWGDEGKGRVADWLAAQADIVARFAGGDNAGHTVRVGEETFKLHVIPSGILHEKVLCIIGAGTVINPLTLLHELESLRKSGVEVTPDRLLIDARAHIITPAHLALDAASEAALGSDAIGTTKRGIGPAYSSKMARTGIRAHSMGDPEQFGDAIQKAVEEGNRTLEALYGQKASDSTPTVAQYVDAARRLKPFIGDGVAKLQDALEARKSVLCEGAQGTFLDIDHGMYPFVTSSSPTVGGALTGLGFGPHHIRRVVGAAKAFSTRVGSGPFPTELFGALGDRLRGTGENPWDEYGTTTGRPRRCGWLDAVSLRYAARLNGMTELFLNKLDVLSDLDMVKIAVAYAIDGKRVTTMPYDLAVLAKAEPVYLELSGWKGDITGARKLNDLPTQARAYVEEVSRIVGVTVTGIGVGPARDQMVLT